MRHWVTSDGLPDIEHMRAHFPLDHLVPVCEGTGCESSKIPMRDFLEAFEQEINEYKTSPVSSIGKNPSSKRSSTKSRKLYLKDLHFERFVQPRCRPIDEPSHAPNSVSDPSSRQSSSYPDICPTPSFLEFSAICSDTLSNGSP